MTSFDSDLGQRIRVLRQKQALTQGALSEHLEVSRQTISNIENGYQSISAEVLWKIAEFFGTPIDSFFGVLTDNTTVASEIRGRLLTAQFHMKKAMEALEDD